MLMSDIRTEWIATIQQYKLSPDRPDNDKFWCTQLDTASQEELRAIQSEKLRVAVRYAYECVPFYRRKFDRIGLKPGDIRSVVDLPLIPVTTKQDILACTPSYAPYLAGVMRELALDPAASSLRYRFCAG